MVKENSGAREALETAIESIESQFGRGSIMRLGGSKPLEGVSVISTGNIALDLALGVGGVPRGRVVEIFGPEGSGKTTLAEAMLFESGLINRRGDVSSKNTVSDYHEIEHEQEGSVFSTVLYSEWLGKKLNIFDTPGLDDFVGGVVSSLYVADTAVLLLNAQNGVEVGAELAFRQTKRVRKADIRERSPIT